MARALEWHALQSVAMRNGNCPTAALMARPPRRSMDPHRLTSHKRSRTRGVNKG